MKKLKQRYQTNKDAKVGKECVCPSCGRIFTKTNYQQAFCRALGGTICKDKYWNTVDPKKRNNTTRISPASAAWLEKQGDRREKEYDPHDDEHPFSSEALGQS